MEKLTMISREKLPAALYAIHSILVKARWLAGEHEDHQKLYKLLDQAELLPPLVYAQEEDTTTEFRDTLADLGREFPECAGFLPDFDRGVS